jgi:hypothetical protein
MKLVVLRSGELTISTNFFKVSLLISLLLLGTDAIGQSGTAVHPAAPATVDSKNLDRGQLDGINYSNNFFGLSLSVPQTWVVLSAQRKETLVEQSGNLLTGDQKKKEELDASIQRSVLLLALTKLPAGEADNASFMLVAERIPSPSIKNGADVIQAMQNAFKGTNVSLEFQGETQTNRIGGADFAVATVKTTSPSGTFMQKIYVTTKNGYALELFYTYQNDADLAALNSIVGTMKMK